MRYSHIGPKCHCPMVNDDVCIAATDKQTHKHINKQKTAHTYWIQTEEIFFFFYFSFSNSLIVKRRFPIYTNFGDWEMTNNRKFISRIPTEKLMNSRFFSTSHIKCTLITLCAIQPFLGMKYSETLCNIITFQCLTLLYSVSYIALAAVCIR